MGSSVITLRTTRQRAYLALVACLLWVAGVEVLPSIHLAMHAQIGAHRHDGNTIVLIDAQGRDTGETLDATADEPPAHAPTDTAHARLARQLDHGHGSAAHHDLATLAPAVPLHAPLPVDRRPRALAATAIATPISRHAPRAAARGPPPRRAR